MMSWFVILLSRSETQVMPYLLKNLLHLISTSQQKMLTNFGPSERPEVFFQPLNKQRILGCNVLLEISAFDFVKFVKFLAKKTNSCQSVISYIFAPIFLVTAASSFKNILFRVWYSRNRKYIFQFAIFRIFQYLKKIILSPRVFSFTSICQFHDCIILSLRVFVTNLKQIW